MGRYKQQPTAGTMARIAEFAPAAGAPPLGLATFDGARAVLIGTGTHAPGSGLPDVPAVADTLADLKSALMGRCGLAGDAVQVVADPATAQVMGGAIAEAADAARGLLLVYYVGHGLVSPEGGLHLAACQSEGFRADQRVSRVEVTALPYAHLRNLVLDSEARSRVVVLDCCFSGKALAGLTNPSDEVANLAQLAGGFVLTSAGGEEIAFAPNGARHTAFTGALLRLLHDGDPHGPQWLTLRQVYRYLAATLPAAGFPRPRLRADGQVGELVLAGNPAYRLPKARTTPPTPRTTGVAPAGECPYPGLAPFSEADQAWFRGRQALVARLVARFGERVDDPRLLVVTGASGSGKSSLLRAGLLPALDRGALGLANSSSWPRRVFTPTADPIGCLAGNLVPLLHAAQPEFGDSGETQRVAVLLRYHPAQVGGLLREALPSTAATEVRAVLVVDQFEEVFTLCEDERERSAFIHALATLASDITPAALVLLGVRADFYGRCTTYPDLAPALEHALVVAAMTATQTREAIEHPAHAAGLRVEPGLVELLLADLGADRDTVDGAGDHPAGAYEPGRLPLLAHALRETWRNRTADTLTVAAYQRTGGIHGALAETAERVLTAFDQDGKDVARLLLLRLVHIGEGSDDTRRRVPRIDLLAGSDEPSRAATVLDAFADARLITIDTDAVEIIHEALLRAWPTMRAWIDNDRAGLRVQQQLIEAGQDWLRHDRDPSTLYAGTRLSLAVEWATPRRRCNLPTTAAEFLAASIAMEEQRQQHQLAQHAATRRRARRDRILAAVLAVLLAGSVTGGGVAVAQWRRADTQQQRAQAERQRSVDQQRAAAARGLTIQAESLRVTEPITAIRVGLAALALSAESQARASLKRTLADARPIRTGIITDSIDIEEMAFSPDGRTLATVGNDFTARLWDISDRSKPRRIATLTGPAYTVGTAAFVDRRTLVMEHGGAVRLWDVSDRSKPRPIATVTGTTSTVAFTSDGRTLATRNFDETVRLWDVSDRGKPRRTAILTGTTDTVAFTSDGRTVVTSSQNDDETRLWDIGEPGKPQRIATLTGESVALALSRDGHTLLTNSDRTAQLWDISNPRKPKSLSALADDVLQVNGAAFSPDGRSLVTTNGFDHAVRWWDISDRSEPQPVDARTGPADTAREVFFSRDGRTLAILSNTEATVRLWDISPTSVIVADPVAEACRVSGGGLTPDEWNKYVPGLDFARTCPAP
jgi:hypothetical protein